MNEHVRFAESGRVAGARPARAAEAVAQVVRERVEWIAVGERPVSVSVSGDGAVAALVNTGSNDLALVAVSPLPLYVPHLVQSATDYSGIALANFGAEQANVALVARDNAGKMLAGTANPVIVTGLPGQAAIGAIEQSGVTHGG